MTQDPLFVHVAKIPPRKRDYGQALCGRTIGVNTPISTDPAEVTCKTCLRRLIEENVPDAQDT